MIEVQRINSVEGLISNTFYYFNTFMLGGLLAGTDISNSPLAPASEFWKKGLSGKYILVFTCPNGQVDFPNTEHIF